MIEVNWYVIDMCRCVLMYERVMRILVGEKNVVWVDNSGAIEKKLFRFKKKRIELVK